MKSSGSSENLHRLPILWSLTFLRRRKFRFLSSRSASVSSRGPTGRADLRLVPSFFFTFIRTLYLESGPKSELSIKSQRKLNRVPSISWDNNADLHGRLSDGSQFVLSKQFALNSCSCIEIRKTHSNIQQCLSKLFCRPWSCPISYELKPDAILKTILAGRKYYNDVIITLCCDLLLKKCKFTKWGLFSLIKTFQTLRSFQFAAENVNLLLSRLCKFIKVKPRAVLLRSSEISISL